MILKFLPKQTVLHKLKNFQQKTAQEGEVFAFTKRDSTSNIQSVFQIQESTEYIYSHRRFQEILENIGDFKVS